MTRNRRKVPELVQPIPENLYPENAEELWSGSGVEIKLPNNQAIPLEEGLHFQVVPEGDPDGSDWRTADIRKVVQEAYYSLPAARVIAESGRTPNLWANVHFNSRPEFVAGANVFGKNPTSETAWAKPVVMREGGVETPENSQNRENLKEYFERYLHHWQSNESENTAVFAKGINEVQKDSVEYNEMRKKEPVIWANDKFILIFIAGGHSNGVHLVVNPRENYWEKRGNMKKAWDTTRSNSPIKNPNDEDEIQERREYIRGFLEMTAILKAAQVVLEEVREAKGIAFENPEIHFSGNWAKDFNPVEEGGRLDTMNYIKADLADDRQTKLRAYKRTHQVGMAEPEQEFRSELHGHLYATRKPDEYVTLPTRPQAEVPEQWEKIEQMTEVEITDVRQAIAWRMPEILSQAIK